MKKRGKGTVFKEAAQQYSRLSAHSYSEHKEQIFFKNQKTKKS